MWNFHGSWFLNLKFPMGVTKFGRVCRGEILFFSRISKGKVTDLEIPGFFSEKYTLNPPPVWIFPGIAYFLLTFVILNFSLDMFNHVLMETIDYFDKRTVSSKIRVFKVVA